MKSILIKLFLVCLCVSFFPLQVFAEGQTGFRPIAEITQRQCTPDRGMEIHLATGHDNPDYCSSNRRIELDCAELWYLPSVALVLTAFAGGNEIQAFVNGCTDEGHAIVKSVTVK
jgi:hypothetical protein